MTLPAHRTPARLLWFAIRCGDHELAELLLRAPGATATSLADDIYDRLARAIGID